MRYLLPALVLALSVLTLGPAQAQAQTEGSQGAGGPIAWRSLSAGQRDALRPLDQLWPTLSAEQQRKWVALTQNFHRLSPEERATLQSRMAEWADLTPAQRTQARLNFGEARKVPADEKRAKWEEYQSLPAEERERLANDRPKPPAGAAPALRPVPPDRILRPVRPTLPAAAPGDAAPPNAGRPAAPVNRNTLLPQPPAPVASQTP
mgnify:CR=1 FL=1